jgi:fructokinase
MIQVRPDRTYDILLMGELLVDVITTEDGIVESFGGSPANISLNLKRLGLDPLLCASYGTDAAGELLSHMIAMELLDTRFLQRLEESTSRVHINQTADTPVPRFERHADKQLVLSDDLRDVIRKAGILHLSFWPFTEEPARQVALEAMRIARANGVLVGFDPNYHPDLSPGYDIQDLFAILRDVNILKPSLDDSRRMFGEGLTPEEYLARYREMGIDLVVMTLGKDGVLAQYQSDVLRLPSLATDIIDATGAGDAFWSGMYAALLHGASFRDTIQAGLLCSAYNLRSVGSITNLPPYTELMSHTKQEDDR